MQSELDSEHASLPLHPLLKQIECLHVHPVDVDVYGHIAPAHWWPKAHQWPDRAGGRIAQGGRIAHLLMSTLTYVRDGFTPSPRASASTPSGVYDPASYRSTPHSCYVVMACIGMAYIVMASTWFAVRLSAVSVELAPIDPPSAAAPIYLWLI